MNTATTRFFGLVAALVFLAGCAATATGSRTSAMRTTVPDVIYQSQAPADTVLVVVRYPAMVEADAEDAYYSAFQNSPIGGRNGSFDAFEAQQVADGIIIKSNYFALSLYDALQERLPGETVLLSPHVLKLDANGALTSEPVTGAETIPNVITVDFATYSFPDPERMMNSEPLTFGDLITPLVTVHTDHRARAPTQGILMSSSPLLGHASGAARSAALGSVGEAQNGNFDPGQRPLDFINFLTRSNTMALPTQQLSVFSPLNSVQVYPLEKITMDRAALSAMAVGKVTGADPLESVFSDSLANRIIALLNIVDAERAGMIQRAAAVSRFDPGLAALSLVSSDDSDVRRRFRYAERMLEAERRFLSVQSQKIFEGIHDGEMGGQVREMLVAEYDVLSTRREIARQQNLATTAAVLGAVAAVGVAASAGDSLSGGEYIAIDLLTDMAAMAAIQAMSLNSESKAVGSNFLQSIVPALDEQISIQVTLLESNETITAIRFEDFRALLEERYAASQRALDSSATQCAYTHTANERIGTWQGECNGGLADGFGVGIVQHADGSAVEYYGAASSGRPDGVGYMIHHGADRTYALEGQFDAGQPTGTMRVSRPGQADMLRHYDGGNDLGPAAPGADAPSLTRSDDGGDILASIARLGGGA